MEFLCSSKEREHSLSILSCYLKLQLIKKFLVLLLSRLANHKVADIFVIGNHMVVKFHFPLIQHLCKFLLAFLIIFFEQPGHQK